MHILLAILSTLSLVAFLIIRASYTVEALKNLSGEASGIRGAFRRFFFKRNANVHPLALIEDPREAVLALMVAIMKDKGDLTVEQIADLEYWAEYRLNYHNPKDMVKLARWHVRDQVESGAVLYRLSKGLTKQCSGEQRADIIDLVESAARGRVEKSHSNNELTQLQAHTVQQLKYRFGDVHQETYSQ
ncbi:hypothetical protein NBRC116602_23890 [Hyphomicrobiales bacterium 4NK60-0047b]